MGFLGTLFLFVALASLGTVVPGYEPPTGSLSTTAALPYLRRQIEVAAGLHKDLAPPEMTSALRGMRPQEKDALADYITRLGNSEVLLDSNRAR